MPPPIPLMEARPLLSQQPQSLAPLGGLVEGFTKEKLEKLENLGKKGAKR